MSGRCGTAAKATALLLGMLEAMGVSPTAVTDIVLSHAHFDHMGSIGKFPNAMLHIQKQEILSWHELMALPRQFGALTEIINPDDLRRAFDASVEHTRVARE